MDFYLSSRKKKRVSLTKESSVLLSKKEVRPVQSLHVKGLKGCVSRVGQIFRIVICTSSMSLVKI